MDIIGNLIAFLLKILGVIMPSLDIDSVFILAIDDAIAFFINTLISASWFIPLDTLVMCLGVIFVVDNFSLVVKIVRWVIDLILDIIPG